MIESFGLLPRKRIIVPSELQALKDLIGSNGVVISAYDNPDPRLIQTNTTRTPPHKTDGDKPYWEFGGTNQFWEINAPKLTMVGTLAVKFRVDPNASARNMVAFSVGTQSSGSNASMGINSANAYHHIFRNRDLTARAGRGRDGDVWILMTWNGTSRYIYGTGTNDGNSTLSYENISTSQFVTTEGNPYRLGVNNAGTGLWFQGRIYGAIIRRGYTSVAQMNDIVIPALNAM